MVIDESEKIDELKKNKDKKFQELEKMRKELQDEGAFDRFEKKVFVDSRGKVIREEPVYTKEELSQRVEKKSYGSFGRKWAEKIFPHKDYSKVKKGGPKWLKEKYKAPKGSFGADYKETVVGSAKAVAGVGYQAGKYGGRFVRAGSKAVAISGLEMGYQTARMAKNAGKRIVYGGKKYEKTGYRIDKKTGKAIATYRIVATKPWGQRAAEGARKYAPTSVVGRQMGGKPVYRRYVTRAKPRYVKRVGRYRRRGIVPTYVKPSEGQWDWNNYSGRSSDDIGSYLSGGRVRHQRVTSPDETGAEYMLGSSNHSNKHIYKKRYINRIKHNRKYKGATKRYYAKKYAPRHFKKRFKKASRKYYKGRKGSSWGGSRDDWGLS